MCVSHAVSFVLDSTRLDRPTPHERKTPGSAPLAFAYSLDTVQELKHINRRCIYMRMDHINVYVIFWAYLVDEFKITIEFLLLRGHDWQHQCQCKQQPQTLHFRFLLWLLFSSFAIFTFSLRCVEGTRFDSIEFQWKNRVESSLLFVDDCNGTAHLLKIQCKRILLVVDDACGPQRQTQGGRGQDEKLTVELTAIGNFYFDLLFTLSLDCSIAVRISTRLFLLFAEIRLLVFFLFGWPNLVSRVCHWNAHLRKHTLWHTHTHAQTVSRGHALNRNANGFRVQSRWKLI